MKKLITICLLMCTIGAWAESVGTLLFTVNKVVVQQGNKARIVTRGSQIFKGDIIVTGTDASAQLKYTNGTLVTIEANTRYQTVDYDLKKDVSLQSNLGIGAISYTSTGKKKALIKTPIVALAILGTKFQLIVVPDRIYLNIIEGKISINGVIYGPGYACSSSSFDKNGKFTCGTIPWTYQASPAAKAIKPNPISATTAGVNVSTPRAAAITPKSSTHATHVTSGATHVTSAATHVTSGATHVTSGATHVTSGATHVTSGLKAVNPSTTIEVTELIPSLLISGVDATNPNLTIEITELVPSLIIDTAMNAIIDIILPLSQLAEVELLFPLVIIGA